MNIQFSEYRPTSSLNQLVQAYWTGDFNLYSENVLKQAVVPNGCIELIIHLTQDHCELTRDGAWQRSPDCTLIGLQTKPYEVRFKQLVQVFGIRFNPEGIYTIFGVPPAEFTSTFENSKDVLGHRFNDYCSKLREVVSIEEKISLTESYLLNKLAGRWNDHDYIKLASGVIRKHHGLISVDELTRQVYISARQLQREFKKRFGITAKEYMRIQRLNAIQKYMQGSAPVSFTELSYESGFTDQSHFIKEFKLLTGINPRGFLKERGKYIVNPVDPG